jgi:Ca2+ transporting ATPase
MLDLKAALIKRRTFDPATRETCEALRPPFVVLDELSGTKVINQAAFDAIWPKLRVLARCQPEDKLALVRGMRASELFRDRAACERLRAEHGIRVFPDYQVVAVTGDGTNDAPALRSADVGFAMGITGTDIAKQACDIMLLDDNFASTVLAVKWGRNVYDSISKFIQFQLTVNVTAISLASVGAFVYDKTPLSAVQMLWVNLIMDSLASLALATERPSEALLDRAPYGKRRPLISKVMIFNILGHSVYQLAVLFPMLFLSPAWMPHGRNGEPVSEYPPAQLGEAGDPTKWTLIFNTFVQMQLFNQFNARRLCTPERLRTRLSEWNTFGGITGNPVFLVIAVVEFAMQVAIVQYGGAAFKITVGGLSAMQWALCVALGALSIPWQFVIQVALLATEGHAQSGSNAASGKDPRVQVADDDVEIAAKGSRPDTKTHNRTASAASRRRSRRDSGTAQAMRQIASANMGASTTSI